MKTLVEAFCAVWVALFALSVSATNYSYYSPYDLANVDYSVASSNRLCFQSKTRDSVFTLSQDVTSPCQVRPEPYNPKGETTYPIVFDFTDGNHLFTVSKGDLDWAGYRGIVTFKGGSWSVPANTRVGLGTNIWDGVKLDTGRASGCYFWCSDGTGNFTAFTNGAELAGNSICLIKAVNKNCTVIISNGSKIQGGILTDRSKEDMDYGLVSNKLVITGLGTFYKTSNLECGSYSSGNTALIDDRAVVNGSGQFQVGYGAFARSNTLTVANHSVVTNGSAMFVGYSAGATHNKIAIRDSQYHSGNAYHADTIGFYGSYNEALFENVNFTLLCRITCGVESGANHNTVTWKGATKIKNSSNAFKYALFGYGQYNTQIFDGYSDNYTNPKMYLSTTEETSAYNGLLRPSTNNTVKIVNGSNMNLFDLVFSAACASNTVLVQDSTLTVTHDISLFGDGNSLVLDDSTFYMSQSGDNLDVGCPNGSVVSVTLQTGVVRDFVDRDNRFVIRGTHPKVLPYTAESNPRGAVYNDSTMTIEVPATGYAAAALPIFEESGMVFHDSSTLEIQVPQAILTNLTAKATYQLAKTFDVASDYVVPSDWTGSQWGYFLSQVNAKLPARCRAYRGENSTFYLEVKPRLRTAIVIR